MRRLLRRLRGILGFGVTWGIAFGVLMYLVGTVVSIVDPPSIDAGEEPARIALLAGIIGFISGAGCAVILTAWEGRRTMRQLSVGRAALWGLLGASTLPLLTAAADSMVFLFGPLGAALAAGSVAIARRAGPAEGPVTRRLDAQG